MARVDMINYLCAKQVSPDEFRFDNLSSRPLLSYLSMQDIARLNQIATDIRLSSKPKLKYQYIDEVLKPRGFKKLASGTNRVVYKCLNDQSVVLKVALDKVGLKDSPAEYRNQFLLKPFVTKVFEVSPCGTVALVERVQPITSREEYIQIAPDVFDLLVNKILGKYVMEDIGSKYFQNIGIRMNFGPVLLDFPYLYELDGNKLYCNKPTDDGGICGGTIDYDSGFNKLVCEKCGKQYFARQLGKYKKENQIIMSKGDQDKMDIVISRGNEVIETLSTAPTSDTFKKPDISATIIKSHIKTKGLKGKPKKNNKPKEKSIETCNGNMKSSSLAGNVDKMFSNKDVVKDNDPKPSSKNKLKDEDETVNVTPSIDIGTDLGNLIKDLEIKDEPNLDTNDEEAVDIVDSVDVKEEEKLVEDVTVVENKNDSEEVFEEDKDIDEEESEDAEVEEGEIPNFVCMVDPSIDDVQDDDGVIYTSEVKAKDDEEIQKIVDDISSAY